MKYAFIFFPPKERFTVEAGSMLDAYAVASLKTADFDWSQVRVTEKFDDTNLDPCQPEKWVDVGSYDRDEIEKNLKEWIAKSASKKSQQNTLFIPYIRGTSASVSEQLVDNGGRTGGSATSGIANDLSATVEKYEADGYEFQKIETIHVDVSPGCIGVLMGKGKEYHPYDYLVFKKVSQ